MPSQSLKLILKHVLDRFVKPEVENVRSIKEVLDLPVSALKDVTDVAGVALSEIFGVKTVRDLSKLDPADPYASVLGQAADAEAYLAERSRLVARVERDVGLEGDLKRTIMVARMIARAWQKRKAYNRAGGETKVLVLGLDNAGKTAMLRAMGGKMGLKDLKALNPTRRVERRVVRTKSLDVHVWDFGGQEDYRQQYLREPEKYFVKTDLVIYVVDAQDPSRFNQSFGFFSEVLRVLEVLGESPYVMVFLHKADPDVVDDPDFQLNVEYAKGRLVDLLRAAGLEFDVYLTSIYNFFSTQPSFARELKEVLSSQTSLVDPAKERVEGLGDVLDSTLNLVIRLANSVDEQFAAINEKLEAIAKQFEYLASGGASRAQGAPGGLPSAVLPSGSTDRNGALPPTPGVTPERVSQSVRSLRSELMDELKGLIRRRGGAID
ncbi:MAG: hypothetical protein Kow0069_18250 [Promethearchaeota archaeon]